MVLENGDINIIADMEGTTGVKLHNKRQKLRSRFDIVKKLGQGTYGKVQLAINKDTGEEVAIKTIKKSKIETEQDLVRIQREIQIMSSVQHPHVIHIYEVFENREKIVLVMEYASGGELYDYISFKKVLEEAEARRVFRQVAAAVFYCHKNMICHRDLKLENILLDERGCAKIADFGLSNVFDERNFLNTFCGSPLYASPEIVRGTPYYGPEVDCWSLGVLLYTLVYGAMPFDGSNFKKLVRQISEGDYYEPKVPSEASHLIRRMLTVDPAKRANISDICCDVWVDLGEDIPLWEVAEEMCKLMPVRLDYLLAATTTATPSSPLPIPPPPPPPLPSEDKRETDLSEGTTLQSVDGSEIDRVLKHKLMTSSSTAVDSLRKKMKDNEDGQADAADDVTGNAIESSNGDVAEVGMDQTNTDQEPPDVLQVCINDVTDSEDRPAEEAVVPSEGSASEEVTTPMETDAPAVVVEPVEKDSSTSTNKRVSLVKRSSITSASKLNKSISAVASNQSSGNRTAKTSCNGGLSSANKVPNLKKSATSVVGEAERKSSITSSRSIAEAKKAFEAKTPVDRKVPIGAAASKVFSVRKAFESPPNTPEVSKTTRSPLARKNSEPNENAGVDSSSDSKKPLVRQGSRKFGVPRSSVSPVKTVRTQPNHHSCVPNEAKMAAADETKKSVSPPPKSVIRRKTPPSPAAGPSESPTRKFSLTKAPSLTKCVTSPRRTSGSTAAVTTSRPPAVRTKSPVKSTKGPSTDSSSDKSKDAESVNDEDGEAVTAADSVDVQDEDVGSLSVGKRGSIEIAPLPPLSKPEDDVEENSPLIRFVPRDKGQFTLLGVKSEVMFDVDGGDGCLATEDESEVEVDQRMVNDEKPPREVEEVDNSKIIRYVATVRRHGSEDANDPGPERVTLLNIRRSATGMSEAGSESGSVEAEPKNSNVNKEAARGYPVKGIEDRFERMSSRTTDDVVKEKTGQQMEQSTSERHGYSVYRSKYRSVQKYRSVVERRDSERTIDENRNTDEDETDDLPAGDLVRSRVNVERSESFSSAGSTDELEDVFESLTSESLFTSLLNRTRNLIERITDGDSQASRFFQSNLFGGSRLIGGSERANSSTAMSLLLNPPSISFRRSPVSTSNFERSSYDGSSSSRDYNRSPTSDVRRWRPSRSTTRGTDDHDQMTFAGSGNIRLRATASFNSSDYSSGGGVGGIGAAGRGYGGDSNRRHQSRYESFRTKEDSLSSPLADSANRRREEARSDIISALLRHRNRSLDGRRPRSLYDDRDDYVGSTTSGCPRGVGGSGFQCGRDQYSEEDHRDPDVKAEVNLKTSSLYGTVRRPNSRYPRYTKSMTKEVDVDDYESSRGLRRPRSIHEILSNSLGNVNGTGEEDDDDGTVSRDYSKSGSKSVNRIGSTEREEEEEYEREHRVTQNAAGRSVTTTQKQVSRSVSQTEDEDKSCSSSVHVHTSSTSLQRKSASRKVGSNEDDGISRQDSGVGSLYDSGSGPSSTSGQSGFRRGRVIKYDRRSVSNDLESLEEEMTRFGLRDDDHQQMEHLSADGGEAVVGGEQEIGAAKTDGASDSADTGSVCSDASGAATETSSSTVKASEEESVGERIRRKSFFARFNDTTTRVPRKARKPEPSTAFLRTDLNRSSSLRQRIFDDETFAGRTHYDSPSDLYGISYRYNPQRWSSQFGNGNDPDFQTYGTGVPPRRRSFQGGCANDHPSTQHHHLVGGRPSSRTWTDDGSMDNPSTGCRPTSPMSRTRSLPEDGDPIADGIYRQTSVSSNASTAARRPTHLGLHTNYSSEEADEWLSPESPSSSRFNWRPSAAASSQRSRMSSSSQPSSSSFSGRDPHEDSRRRPTTTSGLVSNLMDTIDSPSEVLQKAMDLCDSLRYNT